MQLRPHFRFHDDIGMWLRLAAVAAAVAFVLLVLLVPAKAGDARPGALPEVVAGSVAAASRGPILPVVP